MATSKTLKPTNVSISIPAFTDQPDQRLNTNCIDKEADAINALADKLSTASVKKCATANGTVTFEIPHGHYAIVLYAGHMSSVYNAVTETTTVYAGGDSFSDAGFTMTKAANSNNFTLTRTNSNNFQWAMIDIG